MAHGDDTSILYVMAGNLVRPGYIRPIEDHVPVGTVYVSKQRIVRWIYMIFCPIPCRLTVMHYSVIACRITSFLYDIAII